MIYNSVSLCHFLQRVTICYTSLPAHQPATTTSTPTTTQHHHDDQRDNQRRVDGTGQQGQSGRVRSGTGQKGGRRITVPNDASRVVWALGNFFFCFYTTDYCIQVIFTTLKTRRGLKRSTTTRTGANNARCVVWPIGEFFFFSICVFHILIYIYSYYRSYNGTEGPMEGYDDENGPKRVVWAIGKFFFSVFLRVF